MPMAMQWLGSSKLQSAAAQRPVQQPQQQQLLQKGSSLGSASSSSSCSSTRCASSNAHRAAAAAAAAPSSPSSPGSSSSAAASMQVRAAAAAMAAAGAFSLPDPSNPLHTHSLAAFSLDTTCSDFNSSSSISSDCEGVDGGAACAAVDALTVVPDQRWQVSRHLRHSVEEAMKAGIGAMGFVHLPPQQQQQQQQQGRPQHLLEEQQQQQQHATWQQLVQSMDQVGLQHSVSPPDEAASAAAAGRGAAAANAANAASAHAADAGSHATMQPTSSSSSGSSGTSSSSSSSGGSSGSSGSMQTKLQQKSTQQIQACRSPAALEQLLQHSWQGMDHVHVSATFVQLARIQHSKQQQQQQKQQGRQQGLSPEAWSMLQQVALQHLDRLQARHCANIIWACASLGSRPCEPLLQGLVARSKTLLQQGTAPQGFANTLWGLASLGVQPSSQWLGAWFEASQQQLRSFQPQELSSSMWALAQLQQLPPADWKAAFFAVSTAKLGSCSAQSMSNMLWGVAKLGLQAPEYWWAGVTYACSVRAAELSPAGVCQVLWAAGMVAGKQQRRQHQQQQQQQGAGTAQRKPSWGYLNMQQGTPSAAGSAASSTGQPAAPAAAAGGSSQAAADSTQWVVPLLAAVEPHLQQLDGNALSNILWALAVMGHTPDPGFVSSCVSCINAQGGLTASAAVHALWAASSLLQGAGAASDAAGLLQLASQLQQQGLQQAKPQEFVYTAAALAHLAVLQQQQQGQTLPPQQQQQQVQQQEPQLLPPLPAAVQQPSGQGVEGMATACTNPLDGLAQELLAASKLRLSQFQLGQLCQLGRWLAAAGPQPAADWVAAFLAATTPHLHMMQQGQQLLLLHVLAQWHVQPHEGWSALFLSNCTSAAAMESYSAGDVGALLQAMAAAGLQPQPLHLMPLLQRVLQPGAGLDAAAVAGFFLGLFSLGFRPPDGWVQQMWAAGAAAVAGADAQGLAALAAVLQQPGIWELSLRPNKTFVAAYHAAVAAALPQLQPPQAAAVLAALTSARIKPHKQQQYLLPGLMAVAARGMYALPLQDIAAAWWGLVRPRVLNAAVPLEQLMAAAAVPQQPQQQSQQQSQQDQQWLQQQWQSLWLRRLFHSSSESQLASLPPLALLRLADCLRRLQQPAPGSWANAYIAAVAAHIPKLQANELHLLLTALPCLQPAAALPQYADTLLAAAAPVLQDFSPAQLSEVLCSIQRAGLKPPEAWLKAYVRAASRCLEGFWPRQLTHVLTSLARLRFMPDPSFLTAATAAAVAHLPRYKPQPSDMVDLLWAVVALRVRPSAAWMAKFESRLLERGLDSMDGKQLSRLGWCLSALQHKPGHTLWDAWLAATQQQMQNMDGSSLADTLWTCAMLDQQPGKAWLNTFCSSSRQHLGSFSSSSVVIVVWSLALLQHRPTTDWMLDCLAALSRACEATASPAAAAGGAGSPTTPGSKSGSSQQQQQQAASQAEPLTPSQVTRVAWALAALDCRLPTGFSAQLLQVCLQQLPHLDPDTIGQLAMSWDRLDSSPDKLFMQQFAAATQAQLSPGAFEAVMTGLRRGGLPGSGAGSSSSSGVSGTSSGSGRSGSSRGELTLQRPAVRVRVGQQRVVLKPSSTGSSSTSSRGLAGAGVAQVQQQQQQHHYHHQQQHGLLATASAVAPPSLQRSLWTSDGTKLKPSAQQQLKATLHKLYAAELKLSSTGGGSGSGGNTAGSGSSSSAGAELSVL